MITISEREEYIEREYKKWEERYVIPFENEFMVKSLLSLQHQFYTLPDEHIKSKADVLYSIQKIMRDLQLKPIVNKERENILIVTNNRNQTENTHRLLVGLLGDKLIKVKNFSVEGELETKDYRIKIKKGNLALLRGVNANYVLNLTGDKNIDEHFRNVNKL